MDAAAQAGPVAAATAVVATAAESVAVERRRSLKGAR